MTKEEMETELDAEIKELTNIIKWKGYTYTTQDGIMKPIPEIAMLDRARDRKLGIISMKHREHLEPSNAFEDLA